MHRLSLFTCTALIGAALASPVSLTAQDPNGTIYSVGYTTGIAKLQVVDPFTGLVLSETTLKYPGLFNTADVVIITKIDLAEPCEFDRQAVYENITSVRPGIQVFETSAKTGVGLHAWIDYLSERRRRLF